MSDSRKYLIGAAATIVAARIAARSHEHSGGDLAKPVEPPALKDEFVAVYQELEQALDVLGAAGGQKPYGEKHKRENESLLGD